MKNVIISLIGLGYVGLPLALAFDKKTKVIAYDNNKEKIALYQQGIDPTQEMGDHKILASNIQFTANKADLEQANFHIIAVPTPIDDHYKPDLKALRLASETVGSILKKGDTVVYESTVYPGVTETVCLPILEAKSHLKCGHDFNLGYSPERINPGDHRHTLETIVKVVSGNDKKASDFIASVYESVVPAGIYQAESIRVAEAAKVIENTQRDVNIALMNELSTIFKGLNIDTQAVLAAARTKWNFLDFEPGLVGGHCIGVDPYYLSYCAQEIPCSSELILTARKINNEMALTIGESVVKSLLALKISPDKAKVGILGFTFKENTNDIRNSKVFDLYQKLQSYGIETVVCDPYASVDEVKKIYDIDLQPLESLTELDVIILAVAHDQYRTLDHELLKSFYKNDQRILFDLKGVVADTEGFIYDSL